MANFIPNQNDYKNLTPFKTWLLLQINTWGQNNFPFVESDFDELTNYGMMQKLMKALNDVISNENMVEEDMTNLFNAFTELQTYLFDEFADYKSELNASFNEYKGQVDGEIEQFETDITADFNELHDFVDNYFDNNFPQLISDKLDEMAEDGTLENLLNDSAHLTKSYNTYTEMIADSSSFTNGLRLKTLGYYSINDGGGADYYVSNNVIATNYQIELSNNLYLNLIVDDELLVDKIGAHGDGTTNDTTIIQNAINYCIANRKNLLFNGKTYLIDSVNIVGDGLNIYGVKSNNYSKGTIIKAIESNNPLFNIVNTERMSVGGSMNNIALMATNERESYSTALDKLAINILNMAEFNFTNVFISGFKKGGLYAKDYWDSTINSLEIRTSGNETGDSALYLGSDDDSCNSLHIFGLHIENCPYQLHIDGLCSHIQFVASKFEAGSRFDTPYSHLIEIYEGVYNIEFTSCFFTNGRTDCDMILVKNNLTTFNSCTFATSTKNLIKNYSANANYGNGIIINACTFEGFGSESNIDLGTNGLISNCYFEMKTGFNNSIKLSGEYNTLSNNTFKINSNVTSGLLVNCIGTSNMINENNYSFNRNIDIINLKDTLIKNNTNNFLSKTSSFVVDFNKLYSNIFYNGSDLTLTSANLINPHINSEISFFANSGDLTFDSSILAQGNYTLRAGRYVTLKYINAINKWAINEDKIST